MAKDQIIIPTVLPTIIAGSRGIDDYALLKRCLRDSMLVSYITEVVSGHCPSSDKAKKEGRIDSPDMLGEKWAKETLTDIKSFPANWDKHGKKAGMLRNGEMLDYARKSGQGGAAVILYDGKSSGTFDMIERAVHGLKYWYIHVLGSDQPMVSLELILLRMELKRGK